MGDRLSPFSHPVVECVRRLRVPCCKPHRAAKFTSKLGGGYFPAPRVAVVFFAQRIDTRSSICSLPEELNATSTFLSPGFVAAKQLLPDVEGTATLGAKPVPIENVNKASAR
jgi:hypothetical protein